MGWIESLHGKTVGLDTAPIIYFIEENKTYLEQVDLFFLELEAKRISAVTSPITIVEVLTQPFRSGNVELANDYRAILYHISNLRINFLTSQIAEKAAHLRAEYNLRTPDAIQIATAISAGADTFLTNDKQLKRVQDIKVLILGELVHG